MVTLFLIDDNLKVHVPNGKSIREVASKSGASMDFGCRVGDCLTCVASVKSGMVYLNEKTDKEIKALEVLGGDVSEMRLMCQCKVRCDEGEIEISYKV
jgi:ferredoxin